MVVELGPFQSGWVTATVFALSSEGFGFHDFSKASTATSWSDASDLPSADARRSVTNQWCQTWDVRNLFVTDGGPFCSNADKNPTLTIMALAWRASDYLLAELRRGNL